MTPMPPAFHPYRETRRILRGVPREERGVQWVRAYYQASETALGVLEALRAVRRHSEAKIGIGRGSK